MKKVSVIIPAYNEEKRIHNVLEKYALFFREVKLKGNIEKFEILVVINGCTDKTEEIVKEYCKKYKEIRYILFKQGGKGFAITEGFKEALKSDSNLIGFTDADMSTPPNAFYGLVRNIKNYDGAIANRWDRRSKVKKQPLIRQVISRGYNLIVRSLFLFPYHDTQCGAKLFKREAIEKGIGKMRSNKWGYDVPLLFCLRKEAKAKIIEIPTEWNDNPNSHIDIKKTSIRMFFSAIKLRLVHSPLNFIVRFYRRLPKSWQLDIKR
jgi:glycosyltransferase involved in cell wall biosynthesis